MVTEERIVTVALLFILFDGGLQAGDEVLVISGPDEDPGSVFASPRAP